MNRFHIDVRSETFNVGDMEWAQILCTINLLLQRQWPHVSAYLEEGKNHIVYYKGGYNLAAAFERARKRAKKGKAR